MKTFVLEGRNFDRPPQRRSAAHLTTDCDIPCFSEINLSLLVKRSCTEGPSILNYHVCSRKCIQPRLGIGVSRVIIEHRGSTPVLEERLVPHGVTHDSRTIQSNSRRIQISLGEETGVNVHTCCIDFRVLEAPQGSQQCA